MKTTRFRSVTMALLGIGFIALIAQWTAAQNAGTTGTISGTVTADAGEVRALRVKAKDVVHRISYTVYTNKGRYQIFNLPPSSYEVQVVEEGFDSPAQKIELKSSETKIVD